MSKRTPWIIGVLAVILAVVLWQAMPDKRPALPTASPTGSPGPAHTAALPTPRLLIPVPLRVSTATPGASSPAPAAAADLGSTPPDSESEPPSNDPAVEIGKVRRMIVDYHTLMHENPVGTNAEIVQSLMGRNPRQATLVPENGQKLNAKGELVDPWNTPIFFHQLSKDVMEIHSAGPDKIMGTPDDIVLK